MSFVMPPSVFTRGQGIFDFVFKKFVDPWNFLPMAKNRGDSLIKLL